MKRFSFLVVIFENSSNQALFFHSFMWFFVHSPALNPQIMIRLLSEKFNNFKLTIHCRWIKQIRKQPNYIIYSVLGGSFDLSVCWRALNLKTAVSRTAAVSQQSTALIAKPSFYSGSEYRSYIAAFEETKSRILILCCLLAVKLLAYTEPLCVTYANLISIVLFVFRLVVTHKM